MTAPDAASWPLPRCWLCDGHIFRDEPTRVMPGIGLLVHAHCYDAADEPPPPTTTS
jgi:hypothetical protein